MAQRRSDGVMLTLTPIASRRVGPFVAIDVTSNDASSAVPCAKPIDAAAAVPKKSLRHRIQIARDHCDTDQWRRLQQWLNWLARAPS